MIGEYIFTEKEAKMNHISAKMEAKSRKMSSEYRENRGKACISLQMCWESWFYKIVRQEFCFECLTDLVNFINIKRVEML